MQTQIKLQYTFSAIHTNSKKKVPYLVDRTRLGNPELFLSGLSMSNILTMLSFEFPLTQTISPDFAEALLTNLMLIPVKTFKVLGLILLSNKCNRPRVSPKAKRPRPPLTLKNKNYRKM